MCVCVYFIMFKSVESFLESILLLKGSFFTHYITILYCIHMPCVLIINLYYTSKINIIHSFIHVSLYKYEHYYMNIYATRYITHPERNVNIICANNVHTLQTVGQDIPTQ